MSEMNLRRAMLLKLLEERNQLKSEISKLNNILQDHLRLEQRVRHLPKKEFDYILEKDPDLIKELEAYNKGEINVDGRESEERSSSPVGDNEQLPDGP